MSVLTKEPRSATIEANEDRTLLVKFQIKELKEDSSISKFYSNVVKELSSKITNTINSNI